MTVAESLLGRVRALSESGRKSGKREEASETFFAPDFYQPVNVGPNVGNVRLMPDGRVILTPTQLAKFEIYEQDHKLPLAPVEPFEGMYIVGAKSGIKKR